MNFIFSQLFLLFFVIPICLAKPQAYPEHWWKYVDPASAPKWEILPQEAEDDEVILSKRNELGVFSNFADTQIVFRGKVYASVEGLWQSMKYPETKKDPRYNQKVTWPYTRAEVENMIGRAAKKAGSIANKNMKVLGIDWISFNNKKLKYKSKHTKEHYEIISAVLREKVKQHRSVKNLLLKTGDLKLRPDHHQKPNSPPAYKYHDIYMKIRAELQHQ